MSNLKKMIHFGWLGSGTGDPTTNAQGERVILFLGDSNIVGQGATAGPTPTLGTVKYWNGSAIANVTNADITDGLASGNGANIGSMMPKFGIDYNARTGKIPVILSCGRGGAHFASNPDATGNDFSVTGNNRALAEARITAALAANGTTKLAEIVINLGINDFSSVNSFATISTAIDSFMTWITTTYPDVRITFLQIGRSAVSIASRKQSQIRNKLREISEANADVHVIQAPIAMYDYGYYKVDLLHYAQSGNDFLGAAIDNYFEAVDAGYNKFAAGIFCSFKDALNQTKVDAINAFFEAQGDNIALMETLQIFKNDTQANTYLDFVGMLAPVYTSVTYTANTEIATAGTTGSFIDHLWMLDEQLIRCTDQDIVFGCKMGTKTTADGVLAVLFGAVGSVDGTIIGLYQTATPSVLWRVVEDSTTSTVLTTPPDTKFIAQSLYEMARTGANAGSLYRNGVKIQDGTTAYEGTLNRYVKSGGLGNAGATVSAPIAAGYKVFYVARASGFDRTTWDTDLNTLLAAL